MKLFISWSGELSRQLGAALRDWLPSVLQSVRPYFTPDDVDKGARWASHIAKELEDSSMGIFCVTPDNQNSQWMMFEAGAISKRIATANVCPILFGLSASDIKGPLSQFQGTPFEKDEMRKLVQTMNSLLGAQALVDSVLSNVFEKWWPDLNQKVSGILAEDLIHGTPTRRSERDIIDEILELSRLVARSVREELPSPRIDGRTLRQISLSLLDLHDQIDDGPSDEMTRALKLACQGYVSLMDPFVVARPLLDIHIKPIRELAFSISDEIPF